MWGFAGILWVTPLNQESASASGLSCPHLHTCLSFVWPREGGNCEWTLSASVEYIHYRTKRKATRTKIFTLACGLTKPFLSAMIALQLEYACKTRTEWLWNDWRTEWYMIWKNSGVIGGNMISLGFFQKGEKLKSLTAISRKGLVWCSVVLFADLAKYTLIGRQCGTQVVKGIAQNSEKFPQHSSLWSLHQRLPPHFQNQLPWVCWH